MAIGSRERILAEHMEAVRHEFHGLQLGVKEDGGLFVGGSLGFCSTYEEQTVETTYEVEIKISADYPKTVPSAFETGGRIASTFHKLDDGSLCLGAPLEVRMAFAAHPCLLGFIRQQVIPYLFSHACWERTGKMPFGDRKHGAQGILDSYKDLFKIDEHLVVLELLRMLADDDYRDFALCPCSSGRTLPECHGRSLRAIRPHQSRAEFVNDHTAILMHLCKQDPRIHFQSFASWSLKQKIRRRNRRRNQTRE